MTEISRLSLMQTTPCFDGSWSRCRRDARTTICLSPFNILLLAVVVWASRPHVANEGLSLGETPYGRLTYLTAAIS